MKFLLPFTLFLSFAFFTSGCEDFFSTDSTDSAEFDIQEFNAQIAGAWVPPKSLVDRSQKFNITYEGAGPWEGSKSCHGQFTKGAQFLQDWAKENFPQISKIEGYSCRANTANKSEMSVHGTGRALDIFIPLDGDDADNDLGDPVANYLLEHADKMGVQLIIWDRWVWSAGRKGAGKSRAYTGPHPHHDHIHMELTPEASKKMTAWFGAPNDPASAECSDMISKDGAILDNESDCLQLFGEAKYWRSESKGYKGSLRWTNAFKSDEPANWAKWNLQFEEAGSYRVFYYSFPEFSKYDSAQHIIKHGKKTSEIFVDLSAAKEEGWEELGVLRFSKGGQQSIALVDNSPIAVPKNQHIIADAIRLVRVKNLPHRPDNDNDNDNDNDDPNDKKNEQNPDDILSDDGCSTTHSQPLFSLLVLGLLFFFRRLFRKKAFIVQTPLLK